MQKLVIRQSNSRISHLPSESYVDTILSRHIEVPYRMKEKGKNTLSVTFDKHISRNDCRKIATKLGLEIQCISDHRCVLASPY